MAKKKATHTPQSSFRLPAETKAQLQWLSDKFIGAGKTKVLVRAVADMYAREGGPPPPPPKKNPKRWLDVS